MNGMANARFGRAAALAFAVATLNACSSAIREPEVKLDNISVGSIGFDGGTLRVRLNVINPNSFGLQAEGLDYLVEIADEGETGEHAFGSEGLMYVD